MKKTLIISFLILGSSFFTFCGAQYVRPGENNSSTPSATPTPAQNTSFGDKLSVGGSFALQFGDYTLVELEPLINYHFNNNFIVGIGPIYQYESVNEQVYGYPYTASAYGARITALFFLPDDFSRVFIMGECDVINVPEPSFYSPQIFRGNLILPMLGLGYKEPISDKSFICMYALWNFNNSPYNPFANPVFNFGIDIGLWH